MRLLSSTAALAAASLLLIGCSANPGDTASDEGAAQVDEEFGGPEIADADENAGEGAPPAQFDTGNRAIIYEAELSVDDGDPERVAEAAWDLAESFGGFVASDERDGSGDDESRYGRAHLVLRIPSEHFSEAMDELSALGEEERYRSITTEDVTEATVDLASYIATKSASVERVRTLLEEATSVDAILELEAELAEREGELASLQSRLDGLEDRAAMSTIDFTVHTPSSNRYEERESGPGNFWEGLGVGFSGALTLLVGLSVVIGVLLPFLPIAAIAAAAVIVPIRLARKRRNANAAASSPVDTAAGPTGG